MSSKISALASASVVENADLFTLVQGGVNKKVGREVMLIQAPGETIEIKSPTSFISILASENIQIGVSAGDVLIISNSNGSLFEIDVGGDITIEPETGAACLMAGNGAQVNIDATGGIQIIMNAGETVFISYDPLTAGDWTGAPTSVWEALDRIARVVSANGAVPIP